MRQSTKAVVGVLSLGVLASSYSLGLANANEGSSLGGGLSAAGSGGTNAALTEPAPTQSTAAGTGASSTESLASEPKASASASSSTSADSSSSASKATAKSTATPTATATATPTKTAAPTATSTATPTPTKAATSSTTGTQTSDAIRYKYGTVQLSVTKAGGKISSIDVLVGTTKGREYAGVISELVPAAVSANGSGFGNYSGATFTTEAFKSALESALAKF